MQDLFDTGHIFLLQPYNSTVVYPNGFEFQNWFSIYNNFIGLRVFYYYAKNNPL